MAKKPETLTCLQLWRRYHNADKTGEQLRYKLNHFINELHDTERRIRMVKKALSDMRPDTNHAGDITAPMHKEIRFLYRELNQLKDHRKEISFIVTQYKKLCYETTTRANRYNMAYHRIKVIAAGRIPEGTEKPGKFIDEFTCSVQTEKNGRLNIKVEIDDIAGVNGMMEFNC